MRRFESKIHKTETCWLWIGNLSPGGYGMFFMEGKNRIASRVSYSLYVGPIRDSLLVLHKCDNPQCVRPDHLFLGTNSDNMRDMIRKGRQNYVAAKGEAHGHCKLNDDLVRQIIRRLDSGEGQRAIARQLGIACSTVNKLATGKAWPHITGRVNEKRLVSRV
jgi:hypothetical protein